MRPRGDDEVRAIYKYLRSLPATPHAVARSWESAPVDPDEPEGKRLYASYGCMARHGEKGVGQNGADLRKVNTDFPTDDRLRAWLDDPESNRPGTKMPPWKGVIKKADYAPLMTYVRELGSDGKRAAND